MKKIAIIVLITLLVIMGALTAFQTKLIFFPGKLAKNFKFHLDVNQQELFLQTMDGETINALFYPGSNKDVILYLHGNAGDLSNWQYISDDFTSLGYNFLIIDYRGYGKSTGTITEKGLYEDAETAFRYLTQQAGFSDKDIIVYGRSIGTGVATELATRYKVKGLVLEAPFTSLKDLANQMYPFLFPSLILRFHFNNIGKINNVKTPVLFFHGTHDELIPNTHTNKLYDKFIGKKNKIIIEGAGHNDVNSFPEYHQALAKELSLLF
jgi:uncharacterized protein